MSNTTRAIVVEAAGRLAVQTVELHPAAAHEATVRVTALSLNRGEVKRALTLSDAGARPGWDIAGVVEHAAADGSGPAVGCRVVGVLPTGAWAQTVHVPTAQLAALPAAVSDAQAATLPVAGLTALLALRKGGLLLGHKVLVDGASGGVGHFAMQLAKAAGATVYGHVRRPELAAAVAAHCSGGVIVAPTLDAAKASAPYHLIVDSVGGSALGAALSMLAPGGTCVTFGVSESLSCTFNSAEFFRTTGVTLYGLMMFDEIRRGGESAAESLALLARLVETQRLAPLIEIEADWSDVDRIAHQLMQRAYTGKAVLHVS
ncbi:MAG: zinc-binding dehydrogenase [Burkholderiales bacterium]|nr:zinc-binding dehydrogenase [Burkholderiales bacterium]